MKDLRCQNIYKSYGGVKVLQGVTLNVRSGEILGLIGANGAGKSTLIDIISGQLEHDSGDIQLGDTLASGVGTVARARQGLARTFQHPQLAHELTVRENVLVGCAVRKLTGFKQVFSAVAKGIFQPYDDDFSEVETVCAKVALGGIDRLAGDLTFGELRLVEIARVLMSRPKVALLDEPFSGVGDSGVEGIIDALAQLRQAGCAILLVDHNIDLLAPLVDRMALLSQGKIVIDSDVQSCLTSPVFRETYIGVR